MFRTLQQGFMHWSSVQLITSEMNYKKPLYCNIRSQMTPSMKPGIYHVYILLEHNGEFASVKIATCQCEASKC